MAAFLSWAKKVRRAIRCCVRQPEKLLRLSSLCVRPYQLTHTIMELVDRNRRKTLVIPKVGKDRSLWQRLLEQPRLFAIVGHIGRSGGTACPIHLVLGIDIGKIFRPAGS